MTIVLTTTVPAAEYDPAEFSEGHRVVARSLPHEEPYVLVEEDVDRLESNDEGAVVAWIAGEDVTLDGDHPWSVEAR